MNTPAPLKKKKSVGKMLLILLCVALVAVAAVVVAMVASKPHQKQASTSASEDDDYVSKRPENVKELNKIADRVNAETALRGLADKGIIPPLNEDPGVAGFAFAPQVDDQQELVFINLDRQEKLTKTPERPYDKAIIVDSLGGAVEVVPSTPLSSVEDYDYIIQYQHFPTGTGEQEYHQTVYQAKGSGTDKKDGGTVTRRVIYTTTYVFVIDIHTGETLHIHKIGTGKPPLYDIGGGSAPIITSVLSDWSMNYIKDNLIASDSTSQSASVPSTASE